MATVLTDVTCTNNVKLYSSELATSKVSMMCPHCGVAAQLQIIGRAPNIQWMRCTSCMRGVMKESGQILPGQRPLSTPQGMPADDLRIWDEAMNCLGVSAYSAAVMLCRKLLLHIAVSHGLEAKDKNDRSPNFYQAVEHLEVQEIITKRMRPWVDRIKDVGNDANHELTPISQASAMDVATFTHQLLKLAYELDAIQASAAAGETVEE